MLLMQSILPNGALTAWNAQCLTSVKMQCKAVGPGDIIIGVNNKTAYWDMINECKTKNLLKLTIYRAFCDTALMQIKHLLFHNPQVAGDGERLHSCKKPVTLMAIP